MNVCFPGQSYYFDGVLQLYAFNQYGHRWSLETDPGQAPFNSGSTVVPVGDDGWYVNQGPKLTNIRNEVSTPAFHQNRPTLGVGGNGPYNQDEWRRLGYMNAPDDYKNVEVSGIYYPPESCVKGGCYGPEGTDFVIRGGVNEDNFPYTCQATNYHINYSFVGADAGSRLERDLDHGATAGYCKGCINGRELSGGVGIPIMGLGHAFGLKAVVYNNVENTKVHIDLYFDSSGQGNQWKLIWSYIDQGSDRRIDSVRGQTHCDGLDASKAITWGGPVGASFRINAQGVMFKQLTIQEIVPPVWH